MTFPLLLWCPFDLDDLCFDFLFDLLDATVSPTDDVSDVFNFPSAITAATSSSELCSPNAANTLRTFSFC